MVQREVCLGIGWNSQPLPYPVSISCDSEHSPQDQTWPEGHLAVEKMALEMSQPGWQRPPVIAESHPVAEYQAAACSLPPHGGEENCGEKK